MLLRIRQRGHTDYVRDIPHTELRKLITTGSPGTPLHSCRRCDKRRCAMFSGAGERERYSKVPTYPDLAGKVAVVTGGSGGIGAATCRLLAANSVKVAVNGRDEAKIGAVVDAIRSTGGEALGVAADCTDLAAVERMREQ